MTDAVTPYTPSRSLFSRISRNIVKYQHTRPLSVKTDRPVVSFTFDDCPLSVTENAFPLLEAKGWKSTVYVAVGLCGITNHLGLHMSESDVVNAHASGHEIGDHTYSHVDASATSYSEFLLDVEKNKNAFAAHGIPQASTFAYPYGAVTPETKKYLSNNFDFMRGIHSPKNTQKYDLNQAASQRLYSGQDFQSCLSAIEALKHTAGWLIIFTHDVRGTPSEYGCTPDEFSTIVDAVADINADVMTVAAALRHFKAMTP